MTLRPEPTELDREGIEAEILYTTVGLGLFGLKDQEFRHACFRAFNDWLAEHCAGAPKRLFGVAMIAIDDIDRSVTELERCVDIGLRGAMISIGQESGRKLRRRQVREVLVGGRSPRGADQPSRGGDRDQLDEHGKQVRRLRLCVHADDVRDHLHDLLRACSIATGKGQGPFGGERRLLAARRSRADGRPLGARQALGARSTGKRPRSPRAVRRARSSMTTSPVRSCATARPSSIERSSVGRT